MQCAKFTFTFEKSSQGVEAQTIKITSVTADTFFLALFEDQTTLEILIHDVIL